MSQSKWLAISLASLTLTTIVAIAMNYEIYFNRKEEVFHLKPVEVDKPHLPTAIDNTPRISTPQGPAPKVR